MVRLFELQAPEIAGTALPMNLYHGSNSNFSKFNRRPEGVFFTPHREWAENYGSVVIPVYVWAPRVYIVDYDESIDDDIIDALFDRDYMTLSKYIKSLEEQGYYALQTQTDSEMVCVFSNAKIYSAESGLEM